MESNVIVRGVLIVVVLAVLLVLLRVVGSDDAVKPGLAGGQPVSPSEQAAMGIEVDTPEDTVATLVNKVREVEANYAQLQEQNSALAAMENNLEARLSNRLKKSEMSVKQRGDDALREQQQRFEQLLKKASTGGRSATERYEPINEPNGRRAGDTYWVRPLEQGTGGKEGLAAITDKLPSFGAGDKKKRRSASALGDAPFRDDAEQAPIPFFTIAKNSTLVNSTLMTTLIGRVPVGGNVTDPYFFKVIIGKDNLIANGHELPEVAYAIASGESIGDWTLSCVRGTVFSITFVFEDGTIRTVPKAEDVYDRSKKTKQTAIGELSDAFGNPCVPGKKKSNAGRYLVGQIAADAAEAAAIAAAASETTQFDTVGGGGFGSGTVVTGSKSKFVYDATLAGAAKSTADWIRERQAIEFDAVVRKAGANVAIHIQEEIRLDVDPVGRQVNHGQLAGRRYRELD